MVSTHAYLFFLEWPCFNTKMVFDIKDSLDKPHPVIIQLIGDVSSLLALKLKPGIFSFLFNLIFVNQFFQVVYFLIQVSVDVFAFVLGHFGDCVSLGIEDLNLLIQKV